MAELVPFALREAPALIETVFPAQKVSFEAQRERKAGPGQTLTALGSYWKGRKPLILVRAIVLGTLLPKTDDAEKDLEIFEALIGFDIDGLARRAYEANEIKPKDIAAHIDLANPWKYFTYKMRALNVAAGELSHSVFPLDADSEGIQIRWRKETLVEDKIRLLKLFLVTLPTYEERSLLCKRPEELSEEFLLASVWPKVNSHLLHFGVNAHSMQELVQQLGILRYGHRPKIGDTFAGGGSIPFEAARMGCDVFASDLNPVACMLTWGALNIVGASEKRSAEIKGAQRKAIEAAKAKINAFAIEHDSQGNRAKAYLYCLEARCPDSGWLVPLSTTWVVSPRSNSIAKLIPNFTDKCFEIEIVSGVTDAEVQDATSGTIQDGCMVYSLDGKAYRTPIKTIRGDYRNESGDTANRLRRWGKSDFKPRIDDIFQERLYCIQWISKTTLDDSRPCTFFATVTEEDLERERKIDELVITNLEDWQENGLIPDMAIEAGHNTDQPIRERGWSYWHQLFTPRELLTLAILRSEINKPELAPEFCGTLDFCSKLSRWIVRFSAGGGSDFTSNVFSNQALNTLTNWANRSFHEHEFVQNYKCAPISTNVEVKLSPANCINQMQDIFITDPPYADAVHYHEITEFFIAWLRKNPPAPFNDWTWDSRRALAIKGDGDDFRRGMIDAYKAMADHMPANGMQCVMFTHQDTGVWSDMVGIFWAAGLQVVAAWYIATETTSELKKGGYVQGTVTLMLRKRLAGEKAGFKQRVLPAVRSEVQAQIEQMMHLNDEVKEKMGEPVFNDSDLQMAGYAAALKVLTSYTSIGGEDVTAFALRPRRPGEVTVVDEIVQQASEAANSILVPEGLNAVTWQTIDGIQRFYLRMMDMETTGASKLDNYQNFSKAFRVADYTKVMASMAANAARLKCVTDFASRDLTDSTEIGPTPLGCLIIALQQLIGETDPQVVIRQLQEDLIDFMELRPVLIDMVEFLANKSSQEPVRGAAEVLAGRLRNQRALGQD